MIEAEKLLSHRISRRKGLSALAGALASLVVGCVNEKENNSDTPATGTQNPNSSPTEIVRARIEGTKYNFGGVEVEVDSEGLPVKYRLPTDQEGTFNRDLMRSVRAKAIALKETEFAAHVPWDELPSSHYTPSIEKPRTLEMPKDIMTDEELHAKGVEIIQANKKLYIRKQAFEAGGPLESFNGEDRKLIMVAVDGPFVISRFMQNPKYDRVVHLYGGRSDIGTLEDYKTQVLPRWEQSLEQERERIKNAVASGKDPSQGGSGIEFYKEWIFLLKEAKTQQDMLDYIGLFPTSGTLGQYFGPERSKIPNTAVIFFAVGNYISRANHFFLRFEANGILSGEIQKAGGGRDRRPYPEKTHPNPADYTKQPGASPLRPYDLAYSGTDPGRTLNHEIKHDKYNRLDPKDQNEYFTDLDAMEVTIKGYEKWKQSGFTDNTGYYFVWELDDEFGSGYILTRVKDTTPNLSNA